jgi:uncharacterized membrane-anchored protein
MITMTKQTKFIFAVGLQAAIILAIVIFKLSVLASGTEILLRIAPVDPRDMLRGDYVTFQYRDISNISGGNFYTSVKAGDTVHVILQRQGKYWIPSIVQQAKPGGDNLVFIKGKVASVSGGSEKNLFYKSTVHIQYGLEQYFIPEGKGQRLGSFGSEAVAKVAVDDNGNAVIKNILVNGKIWP